MRRRTTAASGFTLTEVLASSIVVAIGLLGHALSVVHHQKLGTLMEERGTAIITAERFIERMRADTDWTGLYTRLRPYSNESPGDTQLRFLGQDTSLHARAPTDYYGDFDTPPRLGDVQILVQVPVGEVSGTPALRENMSAPRYGLPADVNGDGVIDGNSRNNDYLALPVVVRLRWGRPGHDPQEVVVATWIRGSTY